MDRYARERELAVRLAREAGGIALKYRRPGVAFEEKPDDLGPVTAADKEADAHIRAALKAAFPDDGLLTEETPDDGAWRGKSRVWMVDPLDGTKEFVRGADEFAAMIGLAVDGVPAVGAVYRPVGDVMYFASEGAGSFADTSGVQRQLSVDKRVPEPIVVAVSKSHRNKKLEQFLARLGPSIKELPSGSVGLKIGLIATGVASCYLNTSSKTSLWDSCGPNAILTQAGGTITDLFGNPISYTGSVQHLCGLFCATAAAHARLLPRVVETARELAGRLKELPEYPKGAFLEPDE